MKAFKTYQYLDGTPMTERDKGEVGSKFWNEGKWENYVLPFLPDDPSELTLVDMGCNAGIFLTLAKDKGFKTVIGVDSDEKAVARGRAWRDEHGKDYTIMKRKMEEAIDDLPVADYTILANAHYYFTINDWLDYLDKLQYKSRYCIIVTAEKRHGNRCWASAHLPDIRNYFRDWEEVGFIDDVPLEGDPHPRKLWGLCFKSPYVDRVPVDTLDCGNHVQDQFYGEIDAGKEFTATRYYKILKPYRKRWSEEKLNNWMLERMKVYDSVKNDGVKIAILIDSEDKILDGNHRYSMLKHLGNKTVIVRRT